MASTVPTGIYFGFTKPELNDELARYKAAVKQSGSNLVGAGINGQSFTFGPRGDMSLEQWQQELQAALAYFGDGDAPSGSAQVVRFC
jgi:hypothetical protein